MISQNVYVKFDTFNTRDEVLDFVYDEKELNSNINNWKEDLDKYISYKDKHLKKYSEESNYRNIYAYHLTVLIPIELQNQKEEFVKNYMENIDKRFIRNMYVFKFIQKGKVQVNGVPAKKPEIKVSEEDEVVLDGNRISQAPEFVYYLLNKPAGCVSATEDRNDRTVMEYVPSDRKGLFPVGRLDKDSEGLLLMTNNGDIINRMMRAANKHEKEYKVTVDKPVTDEFLKEMAGGVPILDTVTRPCQVEKLGKYKFKIILTQGLNRQIRRMCEVLGYEVKELRRVRIMNIELGNLKPGEYRKVTDQELNELYELIRDSKSEPTPWNNN